jgi:uncharacterized protein
MGPVRLDGSTVLLTGATGGIDRAVARAVHGRGASLILTGRKREVLEELRADLGGRAEARPADLSDPASMRELIGESAEIDVLIANAAVPGSGRLDSYSDEELDRALDVNLRSPMHMTHALVPGMVERGRGHLVYVSSINGKLATPGSSIYSATKFGLRGFAAALRQDLHGTGVGVTCVFPGFVSDAGMWADSKQETPPGIGTRSPEQVAEAIAGAIEKDRGEVDVAPLFVRGSAKLAGVAPGLVAAIQRRAGAAEISENLAEAQKVKR